MRVEKVTRRVSVAEKNIRDGSNLKVYRASAGSGKTFTLVSEYIALAIYGGGGGFSSILAITFTNKATGEMKSRILNALWWMWRGERAGAGYVRKVGELLGGRLSDDDIRLRCGVALRNILWHYDDFDVKTIDSFFQGVVGDIAGLIGYGGRMDVSLDDAGAVSEAVDVIVKRASEGDDASLALLLADYIEKNLDEGTSWDFRRALKRFGGNVCREWYMESGEAVDRVYGDTAVFAQLYGWLQGERAAATAVLEKASDGLTIDFSKFTDGRYLLRHIEKVCRGDADAGSKASSNFLSGNFKKFAVSPELMEQWRNEYESFSNRTAAAFERLNSAELTLGNLNEMRMLRAIDMEVKRIGRESGRILLSKSQELVDGQLRDGENIPFVFERAGRRYRHVMLDEAQDTSQMQFSNLWRLMSGVVAQTDGSGVVVGDAKQSIYRWRGGDWTMLQRLGDEYDPHGLLRLTGNYRSHSRVVEFNNAFFSALRNGMDEPMKSIYSDVRQQARSGKDGGCVRFCGIEASTPEEVEELRMQWLMDAIHTANAAGVDYSQMTILTRTNDEVARVAQCAKAAEIEVSTDEAYTLGGSTAVRMVVAALTFALGEYSGNPRNIEGFFVAREYQRLQQGSETFTEPSLVGGEEALRKYIMSALPKVFVASIGEIARLPIAEGAMRIAAMLGVGRVEGEAQYLLTFFDYICQYSATNPFDVSRFIDDWAADGMRQKVAASAAGGVKAMTIHKAKGLEFHTVFVPYCDWRLMPVNTGVMWCKPHGPGLYDTIPLVPISFGPKARESIYSHDYLGEEAAIETDNLNTLYVAFTRAKANLFVAYAKPRSEGRTVASRRVSEWVERALAAIDPELMEGEIVPAGKEEARDGGRFSPSGEVMELFADVK